MENYFSLLDSQRIFFLEVLAAKARKYCLKKILKSVLISVGPGRPDTIIRAADHQEIVEEVED